MVLLVALVAGGAVVLTRRNHDDSSTTSASAKTSNPSGSGGTTTTSDARDAQGSDAKLPDDWPTYLEPPARVQVHAVNVTTDGKRKTRYVDGYTSMLPQDLYQHVKEQLVNAGYRITMDALEVVHGHGGELWAENDKYTVRVSIGGSVAVLGKPPPPPTSIGYTVIDAG